MKAFTDLRFSNPHMSEQVTALILAGVAALVIGGVAHLGAHRHQSSMAVPLPANALMVNEVTNHAVAIPALDAAETTDNTKNNNANNDSSVLAGTASAKAAPMGIAALFLPPITTPVIQKAAAIVNQAALKPEHIVRTVDIGRNGSLASLLISEADLDNGEVRAITKALSTVFPGRLARGTEVSLRFTKLGDDETLEGLTFQPTVTSEVRLDRLADGKYKAEKVATPLERQRYAVEGVIRTNLISAAKAQNVPRNVIASMVRAFSHELDLQRDLQRGDRFRVLYDQPRAKNGQAVGDATIIYAAVQTPKLRKAVYRVIYNDGTAEYFNDRGQNVRRGLMRTPVDGAHITSGFGMRQHPILGYSKFHKGVDFGAPTGTPIFAAGNGVVVDIGYRSGYGNFVLLQHNKTLSTAYGHMSRFARGLRLGDRVSQGDVIAYVGSTGRSTGPHLHFEVRLNNEPVSPMGVTMEIGNQLAGRSLAQFNAGKLVIESEFRRRTLSVNEASKKPVSVTANTRSRVGTN